MLDAKEQCYVHNCRIRHIFKTGKAETKQKPVEGVTKPPTGPLMPPKYVNVGASSARSGTYQHVGKNERYGFLNIDIPFACGLVYTLYALIIIMVVLCFAK